MVKAVGVSALLGVFRGVRVCIPYAHCTGAAAQFEPCADADL